MKFVWKKHPELPGCLAHKCTVHLCAFGRRALSLSLGLGVLYEKGRYLNDTENFTDMNGEYDTLFSEAYPARAAFAVEGLPKAALVEIEVVAHK